MKAPRADEQTSKLRFQSKQQQLRLLLSERFHGQGLDRQGMSAGSWKARSQAKGGVILGFLFHWEQ